MKKRNRWACWIIAVVTALCLLPRWSAAVHAQQDYAPQEDYETPEVPIGKTVYGDANGDGDVNGKDLILLRQSLAGWDVGMDKAAADCNGDGDVNGKDLILLRQYLAGWDVELG